jgi:predicted transcriptional regulator
MNMLEFVTVKDNILKYLNANKNVNSTHISSDTKFLNLPKDVIETSLNEMFADDTIKINNENGVNLKITRKGENLLSEGGYTNRYQDYRSRTDQHFINSYKGITVIHPSSSKAAFSLNLMSVVSSVFAKRV